MIKRCHLIKKKHNFLCKKFDEIKNERERYLIIIIFA